MKLDPFRTPSHEPQDPFSKDLDKGLDDFLGQVRDLLNGGIKFADNFSATIATFTTDATPGVETAIAHTLKRTPTGFLVLAKDKAAHLFDGASGKDASNYYVRSDVASVTATVLIF